MGPVTLIIKRLHGYLENDTRSTLPSPPRNRNTWPPDHFCSFLMVAVNHFQRLTTYMESKPTIEYLCELQRLVSLSFFSLGPTPTSSWTRA